jgi:hypothetical protein
MNLQKLCAAVFGISAIAYGQTAALRAESSRLPDTYSFLSTNSMVGPKMTVKVNRNGSKELIERTIDRAAGSASAFHDRVLYDFGARRIYTLDLNSQLCTTQEYGSTYAPSQLDPIGGAAEMQRQLAANPPKAMGMDTVNGIRAHVVEIESTEMPGKLWLDEKFDFLVKLILAPGGGAQTTAFEMRELRYEPSPASLFLAPSGCKQVAGVTTATGGHAEFSTDVKVHAEQQLEGASATKHAAVRSGPDSLLGKWEFTGKDSAGVAWSGTLTIGELDRSGYGENPPPFSHRCEFDLRSGDSSQGVDTPCLYDSQTRKLSAGDTPPHVYTALLSADGTMLTQGRWGEGDPAKGTWSARSSQSTGRP